MSNQIAVDTIKQLQGMFMTSGLSQIEAQGTALSTIAGIIQKQSYLDAINYAVAFTVIPVVVAIVLVMMMRSNKSSGKKCAPDRKEVNYGQQPKLAASE